MKKRITSLMLILVVAVSMTMGVSAASYIPDDVTYQNLNGQQLAIKTYTLLPDQDPSDLYPKTSGGMSNMGRFINLGIAIVNTSYIIRVEMESDGRAEIYMSDGTMFRCDHFDASQLYGTNEKKEGATSLHLQEELRYDQSHSMST